MRTIEFNDSEIEAIYAALNARLDNLLPAMRDLGEAWLTSTELRFGQGVSRHLGSSGFEEANPGAFLTWETQTVDVSAGAYRNSYGGGPRRIPADVRPGRRVGRGTPRS